MYNKFSKYVIYAIIDLLEYSGLQNGVSIRFSNGLSVAGADADAENQSFQCWMLYSEMYDKFSKYVIYTIIHLS